MPLEIVRNDITKMKVDAIVPFCQLIERRIVELNISKIIFDLVIIKPLSCLLAGGALGVADKFNHSFTLLTNSDQTQTEPR